MLKYSRTAHSSGLARTIIMVPSCHFRQNPGWVELPLARANFHGPKPVRAIEVLLYLYTVEYQM